MAKFRVATDVDGTFTDSVAISDKGDIFFSKAQSTPEDFSIGVINSIEELAKEIRISTEDLVADTAIFMHGNTVAVNVLAQPLFTITAIALPDCKRC